MKWQQKIQFSKDPIFKWYFLQNNIFNPEYFFRINPRAVETLDLNVTILILCITLEVTMTTSTTMLVTMTITVIESPFPVISLPSLLPVTAGRHFFYNII